MPTHTTNRNYLITVVTCSLLFGACESSFKLNSSGDKLGGPKAEAEPEAPTVIEETSEETETPLVEPQKDLGSFTAEFTPSYGSLQVTWTAAENADGYFLMVARDEACTDMVLSVELGSSDERSHLFSGLDRGAYTACISAVLGDQKKIQKSDVIEVFKKVDESLVIPFATTLHKYNLADGSVSEAFKEADDAYGYRYTLAVDATGVYWIDPIGLQRVGHDGANESLIAELPTVAKKAVRDLEKVGDIFYFAAEKTIYAYHLDTKVLNTLYTATDDMDGWFNGISVDGAKLYAAFYGNVSQVDGTVWPDSQIIAMNVDGSGATTVLTACQGSSYGCSWWTTGTVSWHEDLVARNGSLYVSNIWSAAVTRFSTADWSQTGKFMGDPYTYTYGLSLSPAGEIITVSYGLVIKKDITTAGCEAEYDSKVNCVTYESSSTDIRHQSRKIVEYDGHYYWVQKNTNRVMRTKISDDTTIVLSKERDFPGRLLYINSATFDSYNQVYLVSDSEQIYRISLEGQFLGPIYENLVDIHGLRYDENEKKMYWAEYVTGKVMRANTDGTELEEIHNSGGKKPIGLGLTPDRVYYSDKFSGTGMHSVKRDGSDPVNHTALATVAGPANIENLAKVEFLPGDTPYLFLSGQGSTEILRTDLEGDNPIVVAERTAPGVYGIATDGATRFFYQDDTKLYQTDLDGSNPTVLHDFGTRLEGDLRYIKGN